MHSWARCAHIRWMTCCVRYSLHKPHFKRVVDSNYYTTTRRDLYFVMASILPTHQYDIKIQTTSMKICTSHGTHATNSYSVTEHMPLAWNSEVEWAVFNSILTACSLSHSRHHVSRRAPLDGSRRTKSITSWSRLSGKCEQAATLKYQFRRSSRQIQFLTVSLAIPNPIHEHTYF